MKEAAPFVLPAPNPPNWGPLDGGKEAVVLLLSPNVKAWFGGWKTMLCCCAILVLEPTGVVDLCLSRIDRGCLILQNSISKCSQLRRVGGVLRSAIDLGRSRHVAG